MERAHTGERVAGPSRDGDVPHLRVDETVHHAANAAHGTIYFKMLDDAAFYAANSMVSDRFLLTNAADRHAA